jgi:pyridine nucleotide-disulfide oxidoreductase family protein
MRLLLLGGGHAHAVVLRDFRGADVTLVTPFPHHIYSGMVPGFVAGHYRLDELRIDLAGLAARAGVKLVIGRVAALDAAKRHVRLEDGTTLDYDIASLNLGSIPAAAPGSAENALAAKPFENLMERWLEAKDRVRKVGVVGAGAAGVEIAMAVAFRAAADVTLYSDRPAVAPRVARALQRNGVTLRSNAPVTAVEPGPAVLAGNTREAFDIVIWTAGAAPLAWLRASGLETDAQGFVLVDDKLRSVSHAEVFAAGDCATLRDAPHPKSGVYAVRHGEVLAQNLRGGELRSYAPQRRALALISCGSRYAIAEWNGWSAEGAWAWRWKDRVDRRWVAGFRN